MLIKKRMMSDMPELVSKGTTKETHPSILWDENLYKTWMSLKELQEIAGHYNSEITCMERIDKLMMNIMRSKPEQKSVGDTVQMDIPDNINSIVKFDAQLKFLRSLITIITIHTDQVSGGELKSLWSQILSENQNHAHEDFETIRLEKKRSARDSMMPFLNNAMSKAANYLLRHTIRAHEKYLYQNFNMGMAHSITHDLGVVGAGTNSKECQGQKFLNYLDVSHRVRSLVALGLLNMKTIQTLVSPMDRSTKNTERILDSKHGLEAHKLISFQPYYSKRDKLPDELMTDPFKEFQMDSEQMKCFSYVMKSRGYAASKGIRQIAMELDRILTEIPEENVHFPQEVVSSNLWHTLNDIQEPATGELRTTFQQVKVAIYRMYLTLKDPVELKFFWMILESSLGSSIRLFTTCQSFKDKIKHTIMFNIFLQELSHIAFNLSRMRSDRYHNWNLPTRLQYMYYFWYMSASNMHRYKTGNRRNRADTRSFTLGEKYLEYVNFAQEFDEMMNHSTSSFWKLKESKFQGNDMIPAHPNLDLHLGVLQKKTKSTPQKIMGNSRKRVSTDQSGQENISQEEIWHRPVWLPVQSNSPKESMYRKTTGLELDTSNQPYMFNPETSGTSILGPKTISQDHYVSKNISIRKDIQSHRPKEPTKEGTLDLNLYLGTTSNALNSK